MSAPEPGPLFTVHYLRDRAPLSSDARAYGGPAHGEQWTVDLAEPPPWVELPTGYSSCLYRLVRHPSTGRPAHDYLGNLLYVPLADVVPPTSSPDGAQILAFPRNGPVGRRSRRAAQVTKDMRQEVTATPSTSAADTGSPLDEDVTE